MVQARYRKFANDWRESDKLLSGQKRQPAPRHPSLRHPDFPQTRAALASAGS